MIRRHSLRWRDRVFAIAMLALATGAPAQSPGEAAVTRRATELRETPSDAGRSLGQLPAAAPLTRLEQRQGPWLQVRHAAGATGWLHMFDVGPAGAAQAPAASPGASGGGVLRGVTGLFSRQAATSTTATSTIGIRGLGAEDIANAQPNLQAVAQLEAQRQSEGQAREFAGRAQLRSQNVEPLPTPARRRSSSDPSGSPQQ